MVRMTSRVVLLLPVLVLSFPFLMRADRIGWLEQVNGSRQIRARVALVPK